MNSTTHSLYMRKDGATERELRELLERIETRVATLAGDYFWHKEMFRLTLKRCVLCYHLGLEEVK